ncbi:MAG: hypothetical protein AB1403_05425 [Candidatus Riflebacteria bacterium]
MKYFWSVFFIFIFLPGMLSASGVFLEQGRSFEKTGDINKALETYLSGLKESPDAELFLSAGRLLGKTRKYDQGDRLMKEALEKYPENRALQKLAVLFSEKLGKSSVATEKNSEKEKPSPALSSLGPLPIEQQASAAAEIISELQKIDPEEVKTFETGLQKIIYTCPQSPFAAEACWKLANLYLFAFSEPANEKAIALLEIIIAKYPQAACFSSCFTRLKSIAEKTENWQLLQKTAAMAIQQNCWSEEELNFWKCHEAHAMIRLNQRDTAQAQLQAFAAEHERMPRVADYAEFLLNNL